MLKTSKRDIAAYASLLKLKTLIDNINYNEKTRSVLLNLYYRLKYGLQHKTNSTESTEKKVKYIIKFINDNMISIKIGGTLSKEDTLNLISKFDDNRKIDTEEKLNEHFTEYYGIDTTSEKYEYIEVPQGKIYKYDGKTIININDTDLDNAEKIEKINESEKTKIIYLEGMGPCRGLMVYREKDILIGHLDSINENSKLTRNILEQSLDNPDNNKILKVYYIMGVNNFESTLSKESKICDISTDVLEIIQEKKLIKQTYIVTAFSYDGLTRRIGYVWDWEEEVYWNPFIIFPVIPKVNNEFKIGNILKQQQEEFEYEYYDY